MKKNKVSKVLTVLLVVTAGVASFSVGLSIPTTVALSVKKPEDASFGIRGATTYHVTFYKEYTDSWSNPTVIDVPSGQAIGSATNLSLDDYEFLGWRSSAPSSESYAAEYTTAEVNELVVSSNLSFYPVFKSLAKTAYVNGRYYEINTDVVLETNSIGETLIGYPYVGVEGVAEVTASWHDSRNLYTESGIYQFQEDNGAALIKRRIGFKPNSNWAADWEGTGSSFGIYSWQGDNNSSIHMGVSSGDALYTYIPADYDNFKFSRYSSTATSFTWGNESANFSFSSSIWSNDTLYSKDTTLLAMNSWSSWINDWGSDTATWDRMDPNAVTEVPDNDFHNLNQYKFLQDNHVENYKTYATGADLSAPISIKLRFDDLASRGAYYVQVAESISELASAEIFTTSDTCYHLWNAKLDTTYYYRVATSQSALASAEIRTLTSTSLAPRVMNVPNVLNFRDIGGWETYLVPGQKIKQGLYYRCAQLNKPASSSSTTSKLDNEGQGLAAIKALGIKVDIDLRDKGDIPSQSPANTTDWPVALVDAHIPSGSESVRWEGGSATWQGVTTNIAAQYKTIFETIANCDNAPALLHCTYGADRTGIATFFLESLLGMYLQDMTRDYVWTQFTQGRTVKLTESNAEFPQWISKTEALEGGCFADKMKAHLMGFGITEHTLEHIREIFIDGYVAQA